MAWYLVESQTIASIDSVLTPWQKLAWHFLEANLTSLRTQPHTSRTAHRVTRSVLVQDYEEGGRRCLDVECFARALRVRVVRSLVEPGQHPYRNLVFHWIRQSYTHLGQSPQRLLLSNCSFLHLQPATPPFWREVLESWGCCGDGLRPLPSPLTGSQSDDPPLGAQQPTFQQTRPAPPFDDGLWHRSPTRRDPQSPLTSFTLGAALSLPIGYSPFTSCPFGAPVRSSVASPRASNSSGATHVVLNRPSDADCMDAAAHLLQVLNKLAARGITHIYHLFTGFELGGEPRPKSVDELATTGMARRDRLPRWLCEELIACIPAFALTRVASARALRAASPRTLTSRALPTLMPPTRHVCRNG